MTRLVIVLVLLSAVSRLSAQVPPPLTPGEIARLRAVKWWEISYSYEQMETRVASASLTPGHGYSIGGRPVDGWIQNHLWNFSFDVNGTIAGKSGQSDCRPGADSCIIKYTYPASIGNIAESFNRFDEYHSSEAYPDGLGGWLPGTQSTRVTMDLSGSKTLDGIDANWVRGSLEIDYDANPPRVSATFVSLALVGTVVIAYSGWYRTDTMSTVGGSDYVVDVSPHDSINTRVSIEGSRFVFRGSSTVHLTSPISICDPGPVCGSGTQVGSLNFSSTGEWVIRSNPDSGIAVTRPSAGELFVSGETDTIRWMTDITDSLRILYSLDSGATFAELADSLPAAAGKFGWRIPDTLARKCVVRIESMADTAKNGLSDIFRMKPYVLTWNTTSGDYYAYQPSLDAWGYENTAVDMWPASWFARFNYQGIDPYTSDQYSSWQGGGVFRNAASSLHPDWESFVRTFSVGACYVSTYFGVYSPTALARWSASAGAWGGSCFGIAISNAIVFRNWGNFLGRYGYFPSFAIPAYVVSDTNVIPVVNELFTHQLGNPHLQIRRTVGLLKTPNQTLNEMKTMFASENDPVRTLSILNNGPGGGGHAILAWGLKQDTAAPNIYYVSVYDNSWADSTNAQIVIDTSLNGGNGGWSYALWPGWGGSNWIYLRDPAVNYLFPPTLPASDPGRGSSPFIIEATELQIGLAGAGSIEIRDSLGNLTGFVDSLIRADIPGSYPLIVEDGSEHPPYGYGMDLAPVSVSLGGFTDSGNAAAYFFTGNRTFFAVRPGVQPSDTERYAFDGGLAVFNSAPGPKSYELHTIINESFTEKAFRLDSVVLTQGDSLRVGIVGADGMKIVSSAGSGRNYDLEVVFYSDTGLSRFTAADIPIGPGTVSHAISPAWTNLSGSVLNILVDEGDDGSIDDTLGLSNEVTGVDDDVTRNIPGEYALHRNYPNPFNPVTRIAYDIPATVRVVLSVYDVLGREVARLVDGVKEPGRHEAVFDAGALPGGVYFYTLRAGSFVRTEKMVLMK